MMCQFRKSEFCTEVDKVQSGKSITSLFLYKCLEKQEPVAGNEIILICISIPLLLVLGNYVVVITRNCYIRASLLDHPTLGSCYSQLCSI